jgi:hypothetical protein
LPFPVIWNDVVYAALLAVAFTWLVQTVSRVFKAVIGRTTEFNYHPKNLEAVLERCHFMFPRDNFRFNGLLFTRGMSVRIVTIKRRIIEGQFVGCNQDNVVCLVTDRSVIAQGLDDIEDIKTLG